MDNNSYLNLVSEWQSSKSLKAREKIVLNVVKLVQSIVSKYSGRNNKDDLYQEGMIAAMKACDTFDCTGKAAFLTYLKSCVIFTILDYIRQDHVIPKGSKSMHNYNLSYASVPTCHSEVLALSEVKNVPYNTVVKYASLGSEVSSEALGDTISASDNVFREVAAKEELERLNERLSSLSERDIAILTDYALNEKNNQEIASELGISKQRVHQILKTVQQKLRD